MENNFVLKSHPILKVGNLIQKVILIVGIAKNFFLGKPEMEEVNLYTYNSLSILQFFISEKMYVFPVRSKTN